MLHHAHLLLSRCLTFIDMYFPLSVHNTKVMARLQPQAAQSPTCGNCNPSYAEFLASYVQRLFCLVVTATECHDLQGEDQTAASGLTFTYLNVRVPVSHPTSKAVAAGSGL